MEKIGIINCFNVSKKCSGSGCFKAFNQRTGSFEAYGKQDAEMISFVHCNGCDENSVDEVLKRAKRMAKVGVTTIHLSTCIKAKCPQYETFLNTLLQEFNVVGYSHKTKK